MVAAVPPIFGCAGNGLVGVRWQWFYLALLIACRAFCSRLLNHTVWQVNCRVMPVDSTFAAPLRHR